MRSLTDVFSPGATTIAEGLRTLVVSPERELEPGMTLRASFTFRNQGGAPATGVRVRFNLPEGLIYLVGSGKVDGVVGDDEHGGTALLARPGAEIGDVGPGEERRIEIAYSVAGAIENGSTIELQAAVAAFELAPVGSNVVRLIARSRPDLDNARTTIAFETRDATPVAGSEATITIRVYNAGQSSARDVVIAAPIPEHTSYVPNSARVNGRELERDLLAPFDHVRAPVVTPNLPASATATLAYRVRVDDPLEDPATITASARIASQETPAFTVQPATLTIPAAPSFEGDETFLRVEPEAEIEPGGRLVAILRAANTGSAAAQRVAALLEFGAGLLPVRGSALVDGLPLRERKKEAAGYDLGLIPARSSAELTVLAMVTSPLDDGCELVVRARLRWDTGERAFERVVIVRSRPAFGPRRSFVRRTGGLAVRPSAECEAVVTIANDGSSAASDAVLQLIADPGLEDLRVFEGNAPLELHAQSIDLGEIKPYDSRTLVLRARVHTPHPDREILRLAATLHTQELGESPLGRVQWHVESHPDFSVRTSWVRLVHDDVFRPNQLVDAYVALRNEGTDVAQNVRLLLYVSPEARLESVEGATRDRSSLLLGEILPGATVEARLGLRLLRSLAKAHPVTIESVVTADGLLPTQLEPLTIVTSAEPDFGVGSLQSEPADSADAGSEIAYALHVRNSGDGPARSVTLRVEALDELIYVPNSTTVNEVPVRDAGAISPLTGERGIVLSDVDPGIEATIRWREVVHNACASGATIVRAATISYDGDRADVITARELKVRCEPAFANAISGLPFGLDGMLGPSLTGGHALAASGDRFIALPPAMPVGVARANGHAGDEPGAAEAIETAIAFDAARLARTLRYLQETRFNALVDHLFAIRAFLPDCAGSGDGAALHDLREALRETLDRLFIKLRLPNYTLGARDVEPAATRERVRAFVAALAPGECAFDAGALLSLRGRIDAGEVRAIAQRLADAPTPSALTWALLARLLPSDVSEMGRYRGLLIASFDDLVAVNEAAFVETLQRRRYPVLDATLQGLREQLAAAPA